VPETLSDLVEYLDQYLDINTFPDASQNGLQVENRCRIGKVGLAVDACLESILKASEAKCNLLLVHHGLLWGESLPIRGLHYNRIRALIQADMALYSAHLPLDAHPEVGNNEQIAKRLQLTEKEPFALYKNKFIGVKGFLPSPLSWDKTLKTCRNSIGTETQLFRFGPDEISCLGIVSGSASEPALFQEATESGIELLITGEPKQTAYYLAQESGLNVYFGGHYQTETFGVKALGDHLKGRLDLEVEFIDTACPI